MIIATAGGRTSKRWKNETTTWAALCDRLRVPKRTGETLAEYRAMTKDEQSARKDVGGFVGGELIGRERKKGAVRERWLITLDADAAALDDFDNFTTFFDCAVCVYSTHSHTHEQPRLRWVLPLDRPVPQEQYEPIARRVAEWIGIDTFDRSSYQPERLMYWPSCPEDADYYFREAKGRPVCADEVLRSFCRDGEQDGWRDVSRWPIGKTETDIVRRELKRQEDPTAKRGIVGAFCRAYDVPSAIDAFDLPYEPCDVDGRYTYTGGSTAAGAVVYGDGRWIYSNHATDPASGMLCNAFDLVRVHRFGAEDAGKVGAGAAGDQLPSFRAMTEFAASLPEIKRQLVAERTESANRDFADMGVCTGMGAGTGVGAGAGADDERVGVCVGACTGVGEDPDAETWADELGVNRKTGEPDSTRNNAILILRHDPSLRGRIAYNELTERVTVRRDLPWRRYAPDDRGQDGWTDADDAQIRLYYETKWAYKGERNIQDALSIVACHDNRYHPIREYLLALPPWDGVVRADTLFVRYMGAEDSEYVRAVTRKWLCAAVARVMRPGCKFDNMITLVGDQGAGKSQFGMIMSQGWFSNSLERMDGAAAYEAVHSAWIIEIAELAASKKSEVETVKNFISKQVDSWRRAYGHNVEDYPRQCVFYGTTNVSEFLRDRTGARRFWPVEVRRVNDGKLVGLGEEVDLIWAEALARWRAGESLWLDDSRLYEQAERVQEMHSEQDESVGMVQEYLDMPVPENWYDMDVDDRIDFVRGRSLANKAECTRVRDTISVVEIRVELYGEDRKSMTPGRDYTTRNIAEVMSRMPGWRKTGRKIRVKGYGPQWCYTRVGASECSDVEQEEEDIFA